MTPLTWLCCQNARDLSSIDGNRVRAGALIRSDNLDQLDDVGLAAVQAAGISRIVDLRSTWECETYPSPFAKDERWLNVPLTDATDPDVATWDLFEQYRVLIDDYPYRFASAIAAIAAAPPGCVLVTCHAGKDRTGLVIALTSTYSAYLTRQSPLTTPQPPSPHQPAPSPNSPHRTPKPCSGFCGTSRVSTTERRPTYCRQG